MKLKHDWLPLCPQGAEFVVVATVLTRWGVDAAWYEKKFKAGQYTANGKTFDDRDPDPFRTEYVEWARPDGFDMAGAPYSLVPVPQSGDWVDVDDEGGGMFTLAEPATVRTKDSDSSPQIPLPKGRHVADEKMFGAKPAGGWRVQRWVPSTAPAAESQLIAKAMDEAGRAWVTVGKQGDANYIVPAGVTAVRYGVEGNWYEHVVTAGQSIQITNGMAQSGADPAPGQVKILQAYLLTDAVPTDPPGPKPDPVPSPGPGPTPAPPGPADPPYVPIPEIQSLHSLAWNLHLIVNGQTDLAIAEMSSRIYAGGKAANLLEAASMARGLMIETMKLPRITAAEIGLPEK